jgi:hypothetical protein
MIVLVHAGLVLVVQTVAILFRRSVALQIALMCIVVGMVSILWVLSPPPQSIVIELPRGNGLELREFVIDHSGSTALTALMLLGLASLLFAAARRGKPMPRITSWVASLLAIFVALQIAGATLGLFLFASSGQLYQFALWTNVVEKSSDYLYLVPFTVLATFAVFALLRKGNSKSAQ